MSFIEKRLTQVGFIEESLLDTIGRILQPARPPQTTADLQQPTRAAVASDYNTLASKFRVEQDRVSRVKEARKRYDEDPRDEGIVKTLARDAVKGGFQLEVQNAQAAAEAEALRDRLRMNTRLDDWVRLTFKDGDSFLELGATAERDIVEVTRKPTLNMRRNTDDKDRFPDPERAFWYSDQTHTLMPPANALWFALWRIIHVRWEHDEGNRYGRPLMSSGGGAWKRIQEGEKDLAIRRKVRAGMRYIHIVDGGDEAAILRYKERNKIALENADAAIVDFFSNKAGGISAIQGDSNIGNIDDLIHHIDTWWIGSPVPKGILGYGKDLNRDVLDEQKEQYDETLEQIQEWVASEIVVPLLEAQWLLKGILPETLEYELTWPRKAVITPDDILKAAQAAQLLRALNVPDKVIAIILARYLPGVEPEMLMAEFATNDAARLASIASQLARALGNPDLAQAAANTQ